MMQSYALPVELLDEREVHARYKEIDAAVAKARDNIARAVEGKGLKKAGRFTRPADLERLSR